MDLRPVWGSPIKIKKVIDTNERLGELRGEEPGFLPAPVWLASSPARSGS
jgi:hypothetical protein